jgi:hypothetical protein
MSLRRRHMIEGEPLTVLTDVTNPVHAASSVREIAPFIRDEALRRLGNLMRYLCFWHTSRCLTYPDWR